MTSRPAANESNPPRPGDGTTGSPPATVAILGAGISGLAAAHRLQKISPKTQVTIYEASDRAGGVIHTEQVDGFLIEQSADSFLCNDQLPWAGELATELGMDDHLIAPQSEGRRALIVQGCRTPPVPEGFYLMAAADLTDTWRSPLLSRAGKWRLWAERLVPPADKDMEESLTDFAIRRVGREAFERLVQPLVSGIYSADPDKLSVAAALPQFVRMEQEHGSITAGLKQRGEQTRRTAGARYQMFRTPRRGLQSLVDRTAASLTTETIRYRSPVQQVARLNDESANNQWRVTTEQGTEDYAAIISALPAPTAARVLAPANANLAAALGAIEHVGIAVVCLGFHRQQIHHPLDAFGMVVPAIEQRDSIAISFSSNKFPGRAPKDHVLLRVFMGGALRPDLLTLSNDELATRAIVEAATLLNITGDPVLQRVHRWQATTPQYHLGHSQRMENIQAHIKDTPGLAIAGNTIKGVGIPQCIRSGFAAAEQIQSWLARATNEH